MFIIEAMVPPLAPPFAPLTPMLMEVHGSPKRSCASRCRNQTPMSDGTESNPHEWTMRAPLSVARSWYRSIIRCIH